MVTIRPARPEDAVRVWPLARAFATSFRPELKPFERTFAALLERSDTLLAVASTPDVAGGDGGHDDAVVGYLLASAHLTFLANGPVCWVEEVMVAPDARRAGTGKGLMTCAEDWAREQGCAYVSLASRRAGEFYRALGYEDSAVFFKKAVPDQAA